MQNTTRTTNLLYLCLLLFGVSNLQLHTCAPGEQISERFFYDNNNNYDYNKYNNNARSQLNSRTKHEAGVYETSDEEKDTKLKLLEESRTDPIPLEFYQEMNNVSDISDFIERFVADDGIDPQLGIREKISNNVERAAGNIAKPAECTTDNAIVELMPLNPSTDPDIFYFPKCTRVKRCSGCCSSPLLSCQPVEQEVVAFQVMKYRFVGTGKRTRALGQEHVLVEQHIKCICDCRIKKEDCNSYQVYEASQCRCICTNSDAREKCFSQDDKLWDYEACKCRCRETQHCTTGTVFDESQCKCIESIVPGPDGLVTTNAAVLDRKRFIVKAIEIEPNNSTIYDTRS